MNKENINQPETVAITGEKIWLSIRTRGFELTGCFSKQRIDAVLGFVAQCALEQHEETKITPYSSDNKPK